MLELEATRMLLLAGDKMNKGEIRPIGVRWFEEGILIITVYTVAVVLREVR